MSDLLKGLVGGSAGAYAWLFPSALVLGAFWLLIYPELEDPRLLWQIELLSPGEQAGLYVALTAALGLLLNAASTPLYRLLEGYQGWPRWLQKWGERRQRDVKAGKAKGLTGTGWLLGLQQEELSRFPEDDDQVTPTRLGNAIRAFETYGKRRFNLDSQTMWTELSAQVPKYLQDELDRSRAGVDFFVALIYLSLAFGVASIALGIVEHWNLWILAWGIVALLSSRAWYLMAVVSVSYWASTVQALVNLGRVKLAPALGLKLPETLDEERTMWGHVTRFVFYGDPAAAAALDAYRAPATAEAEADEEQNAEEEKKEEAAADADDDGAGEKGDVT